MCLYKVGDLVHYKLDPIDTNIYIVTAITSNVFCTYDLRLTTSPFTLLTDVPQDHITDTVDPLPPPADGEGRDLETYEAPEDHITDTVDPIDPADSEARDLRSYLDDPIITLAPPDSDADGEVY